MFHMIGKGKDAKSCGLCAEKVGFERMLPKKYGSNFDFLCGASQIKALTCRNRN